MIMPELSLEAVPIWQPKDGCPVQLSKLLDLSGGQEEYVQEFIDLFLDETDECMGSMERAIKAGDIKGVKDSAHKYYGGSAACGVNTILPPLRKLIDGAKAGHLNGAAILYGQITKELIQVRRFLDDYVNNVNGARLRN